MPSSSSDSISRETSKGALSSSGKSRKKDELKVSESENAINTQRDYLALLSMSLVQLPKCILVVNILHQYGNGAFYFTYIFMMMVCGLPVLYMEVFLGQYTRQVSMLAWKMSPISYGVFMYLHIIAFFLTDLNGILGSKLWWYMYKGVSEYDRGFPWSKCGEERGNVKCYNASSHKLSPDCKAVGLNIACPGNLTYQLAETQYFERAFLGETSLFEIRWNELTCYAFYWLIVFLFLLKKSFSPKLALFTLGLVFTFVIILLLHVVIEFTVDTALMGKFFFVQSDRLFDTNTWYMAFIYMHLTLMPTSPTAFAYSTCVRFNAKPAIHILIVTFTYLLLELLVVVTSYKILGIIATHMNISTNALQIRFQIGIIFCTYPNFLNKLPLGKMWTAVFLVTAQLSAVVNQVMVVSGVVYSIAMAYNLQRYRIILVAVYCGLSFLLSIPVTTKIGQLLLFQVVQIILYRGIAIGFALETATVFWSYGITRLSDDIHFMCGAKPNRFWTTTWRLVPIVGLVATVFSVAFFEEAYINPELYKEFTLGINIASAVIFSIVLLRAGQKVIKYAKEHDLSSLFEPTFDWGPPNKLLRKARKRFYPDKYIPSQPLSAYNTSSTSWRLVKEEMKGAHFVSRVVDNADRSSEDKKAKPSRKILFF